MAGFFKRKSFEEKFRVFGSAYWESPNGYNLEKSDKLVLPTNALQTLTKLGLDFPMTLRVTPISTEIEVEKNINNKKDSFDDISNEFDSQNSKNNKNKNSISNTNSKTEIETIDLTQQEFNFIDKETGASLILSNVVDFSAPDGMIYMSNWMSSKLGLSESGKSVVKLEAVTCINSNNNKNEIKGTNNNKNIGNLAHLVRYPCLDYVELQPFSIGLVLSCSNLNDLIRKNLDLYYSSLRKGDIITVWYNNEPHKLEVINIRGKFINYVPKVVIIPETGGYTLGFSKAKDYEKYQRNLMQKNEKKDKKEPAAAAAASEKKEDVEDGDSSSEDEWEIVKVGPLKYGKSEQSGLKVSLDDKDASYAKIESVIKDVSEVSEKNSNKDVSDKFDFDVLDAENIENIENIEDIENIDDIDKKGNDNDNNKNKTEEINEKKVFVDSKIINANNENNEKNEKNVEKNNNSIDANSDADAEIDDDMDAATEDMDTVATGANKELEKDAKDKYGIDEDEIWYCTQCNESNLKTYAFCPKCGLSQSELLDEKKDTFEDIKKGNIIDNKEKVNEKFFNPKIDLNNSLQVVDVINNNVYEPGETRNTGWELRNVSKYDINIKVKLSQIAGHGENDGFSITYETPFEIKVKPNESIFYVLLARVPVIPGKYEQVFELRDNNDFNTLLCKKLRLAYKVSNVFDNEKEGKIKKLYGLGFTKDRKRIVEVLKKHKWNLDQAVNDLLLS